MVRFLTSFCLRCMSLQHGLSIRWTPTRLKFVTLLPVIHLLSVSLVKQWAMTDQTASATDVKLSNAFRSIREADWQDNC